jgi:AbrB family looped-hinge helix DNA binding protein
MIAKVSVKGQMVIPEAVRDQARIRPGDELEVGYFNGLIVLRKRRPLTAARVSSLLLAGRELPEMTARDQGAVFKAIERVRDRDRA